MWLSSGESASMVCHVTRNCFESNITKKVNKQCIKSAITSCHACKLLIMTSTMSAIIVLYLITYCSHSDHVHISNEKNISPPPKAFHLDCLWDVADRTRVQPNQPCHFSHDGVCVFEPAVKHQKHYSIAT